MRKSPTVTVIITSFNQESFLHEAIESVLAQNWRPQQIIVADDYSTGDNSRDLIRSYEDRYSGWLQAIYQQSHLGIPRNRNAALAEVTSEYVTVLDGDDRFLPNYLAEHVRALQWSAAECSYSTFYKWYPTGERVPAHSFYEPEGEVAGHFAGGRMGILHSLLARTDLVREAGAFDVRLPWHDGFVLGLRLSKMTHFCHVSSALMEKREHARGVSKSIKANDLVEQFRIIISEVREVLPSLTDEDRQIARTTWRRRLLEAQVRADLEEHKKLTAHCRIIKSMLAEPGRFRPLLRLLRKTRLSSRTKS